MNNPSIAKNSLFLYFRLIFTLIVSLYSSRVLLDVIGIEDFGIYNVVAGFISLTFFFKNTLVDATQRYLTIELGKKNYKRYNDIYSLCTNLHILLAVALLFFFLSFGIWFVENKLVFPIERESAVIAVFISAVFNFIVGIISAPLLATIVSHELMSVYAYFSILNVCLKLGIILLLGLYNGQFDKLILYSLLLLIITIIEFVLQYIYVRKKFKWIKYRKYWDKETLLSIIKFSGWNMIGSCAILLISQGGNILLNLFFGPVVNAANGIAYQVMGAVRQFSSSFQSAINPRLIKLYAQENFSKMLDLCISGSKISFFLFIIIGIPLCYRIDYILDLWLVDVPNYAPLFCILVLITASIEAIGYPIITVIRATGKLKGYQLWVSAVLLLSIPASYVTLRNGGDAYIVFVCNALFTLIAAFTRILYLRKCLNFSLKNFIYRLFTRILLVFITSLTLSYIPFKFNTERFSFFCIQVIISVIISVISIYYLGLEKEEKNYLKKMSHKNQYQI